MISGDGILDSRINATDKDIIRWNEPRTSGYLLGGFNFDNTVDNEDKNDNWYFNQNKSS